MHRKIVALLLAAALGFGAPATALAQDNTAVAVNKKDGSSIFKLAFQIVRVTGEIVDQSNAAVAYASCESCQTVAIAIQIVIVMSDPSVVTPQNLALAINDGCNLCETLASAVQFVVGTGGPVEFTKEGKEALNRIRKEFQELKHSGLSILEIQARVDELTAQIAEILATQLVPVETDDEDQGDGETSDEATAEPTPEPTESATPSEEPTSEPSPSSEPSSEPTPEPSPSSTP
jgi:putative peptide zinc metalloprotease protein